MTYFHEKNLSEALLRIEEIHWRTGFCLFHPENRADEQVVNTRVIPV